MATRRGAIYRAQIAALEFIGRDKSRPYVILTPYSIASLLREVARRRRDRGSDEATQTASKTPIALPPATMTGVTLTSGNNPMFPSSDTSLLLLNDEEMDALEAVLVSDAVPDDCMDLEMLDGFLAAVLLSPGLIERERWLPEVWSAHGEMDFGPGNVVQRAIQLVLAYHNEMVTTLGRENRDECWEPLCFALGDENDRTGIGDGWIDGFIQGLELWPEDWQEGLPDEIADDVQNIVRRIISPWESDEADAADDETRLGWLEAAGEVINEAFARWRAIGLPAPQPIEHGASSSPPSKGERNGPCPCGSGKKYKKCCGADRG